MSTRTWDVLFIGTALFGALACTRYYVVAVLERDRLISTSAAAGFFLFTIAAVLYFLWFLL